MTDSAATVPAAAVPAANAADANGAGEPASKFAKFNTAEKKEGLKVSHAREHEAQLNVKVKQCHRQWKRGYFAGVSENVPGDRVGMNTQAATPVTVWDAGVGGWTAGVFHRGVLSRSEDPDMAVVVVDGHVVVAPLQLVRKLPNA